MNKNGCFRLKRAHKIRHLLCKSTQNLEFRQKTPLETLKKVWYNVESEQKPALSVRYSQRNK